MIVKVCGQVPKEKKLTDAGTDLCADASIVVLPWSTACVPLGFKAEFPPNIVAIIKDRSGLALKQCYTHGGVIDSSYRGEWKVIVSNNSKVAWTILKGDRIAQVLFVPVLHVTWIPTEKLSDSERGSGGFGSTGK
jgi:dUTP pyrophosphatase